jgi:dihydroflavonol-4-reductase
MKVFVTGGTGFIGGHVVRQLRARGDEAVALVRTPEKGAPLRDIGCDLMGGDLSDQATLREGMRGCDAVIHSAAVYEVGIPKSEHEAMYEANVLGTERVLRAVLEERIPKVVYISTVGAFGNTRGNVVDETYTHPGGDYTSYYEETKVKAHQIARRLIDDEGLPCVIVQPGGVYGPGDHSELGNMIDQAATGKLKMLMFPETGFNLVHVEDVADGILLAYDKGETGQSYVLGGQISKMRELVEKVSEIAGRKAPTRELPPALMKMAIPIGPLVGKALGFPPNLRELIRTSDGVTFWAKDDKARRELGYAPRDMDTGLRQTLAA